ncbi:MAG: DinB family protein [Terriglobia bacterium]
MSEVKRIVDQFRRAFEGYAWHGPALWDLLGDVTSQQAFAKPLAGAHSIWEIVNHVAVWEGVVRRRIRGEVINGLSPEQDWPAVNDSSEAAWQETLTRLERGNHELRDTIAAMSDEQLKEAVLGQSYTFYVMLHGVIQHDLYHAGQVAVLKKGR